MNDMFAIAIAIGGVCAAFAVCGIGLLWLSGRTPNGD